MSKIALSGPASGTATYTISAPTGSTDRTITLPDVTGTLVTSTSGSVSQAMLASGVAGNGPAFSAYQSSAQSVSANTLTKVQFQAEEFDTNSCFDTSTHRFTPTVAGYYQINASVTTAPPPGFYLQLNKNGSAFKFGTNTSNTSTNSYAALLSVLIYLNGSTDYIDLYIYQFATQNLEASAAKTYFQAFLARSAT